MDKAKMNRLGVAYKALDAATADLLDENEAINVLVGFAAKIAADQAGRHGVDAKARSAFVNIAEQMFDAAVTGRDAS